MRGRLLLTRQRSGAWNLALDEALFLNARPETVTLRLYGWRPATLSLGAFQACGEVPEWLRSRYPLVRRSSGGQAILHREDEITFSLSGLGNPATGARQLPDPLWLQKWIHGAFGAVLAASGFQTTAPSPAAPADSFFCYNSITSMDLCLLRPGGFEPEKLLGTAQRRRGPAWLIHGFLALSSDPDIPGSVGLLEALPAPTSAEGLRDRLLSALAEGLTRAMDLPFTEGGLTPEEARLADRLVVSRFGSRAWLHRK